MKHIESSGSRAVRVFTAPIVWLLAAVVLGLESLAGALSRFLESYARSVDRLEAVVARAARALWRGLLQLGRVLVRLLGPLGSLLRTVLRAPIRALRRLTGGLQRALRRCVNWLSVWLIDRMFGPPFKRLFRWIAGRFPRLLRGLQRALTRALACLAPLTRRLDALTSLVGRAAARFRIGLRRAWTPVVTAAARWRRREHRG